VKRKNGKHSLRMPKDIDRRDTRDAVQMNIGQNPIAQKRTAVEFHTELVTYGAMSAITADQPRCLYGLFPADTANVKPNLRHPPRTCIFNAQKRLSRQGSEANHS
jgi:hypothetical protein